MIETSVSHSTPSPAAGSMRVYREEQAAVVAAALGGPESERS
jgi:hypothetical protein